MATNPKSAELPHSERNDWQIIAPYFEKVLDAARPLRGAIEAYADETSDVQAKKRLRSLAADLGNSRSVDEVFNYGNDIDPARMEALNWGSLRHKRKLKSSAKRPQSMANSTNRMVWRTLGYPLLVLTALLLFGLLMWNALIPQFRSMFDEFQLPLPPPTELVLGMRPFLIAGIFVCASAFLMWTLRKRIFGRGLRQRVAFRVPILGFVYRSSSYGKLCHILSILLRHGAPIEPALRVAARATLPKTLADNADRLAETSPDFTPAASAAQFPRRLVVAMRTPLDNQQRSELLSELAEDLYARATRRSLLFWEPLLICFTGMGVGFVAIALFMPLVSLVTNLSG